MYVITFKPSYFRQSLFAAFPSIHQSCNSLHAFLIEEKSIKSPLAGNIKIILRLTYWK